jgi:hypothetical protein
MASEPQPGGLCWRRGALSRQRLARRTTLLQTHLACRAKSDSLSHKVAGTWRVRTPILPSSNAPLRLQCDFDRLFAEFGRTLDVVGGYADDAEPDLRDGPAKLTKRRTGSHFRQKRNPTALQFTEIPDFFTTR